MSMHCSKRRNSENMIKKLSNFIVNKRNLILVIMLILAVVSMVCSQFVEINEDMTKYLPDDSNMKAGIDIMAEEFPEMETSNTIRVMFDDLTSDQKEGVLTKLSKIEHVDSVDYDAESSDYNKDNHTLYVLNMSCEYGSDEELSIQDALDSEFADYTMVWKNDDTSLPHLPFIIIATALATWFGTSLATGVLTSRSPTRGRHIAPNGLRSWSAILTTPPSSVGVPSMRPRCSRITISL